MDQRITHTVHNLPADVEQGIMIGLDGVIGNIGGVTLSGAKQGSSVAICLAGKCEIQALNDTLDPSQNGFIEIDSNGRARAFTAGLKVGFPLEDSGNPVNGVYRLTSVYLFGRKADPALVDSLADVDLTVQDADNDAVVIDVQLVEQDGSPLAEAVDILATVYEGTMVPATVGEFTLAETGAGSEITTTGNPSLVFRTDATGAAQITVTDVGQDRTESIPVTFEVLGRKSVTAKRLAFAVFT